ncbi:LysM peptidoglycan-binding domain-containing protein [Streptomyces sp. NBC_00335]|uniref:LysM peptidoglycan-binding domain-containing protein n=1 Tax=unclassified Streptomyces TaxID=2593676 RepID=UPI00225C3E74|nr:MULTISPECIES: LysM peptidoglycan-binding domain-containing protein [unclassified Streptomyces]MCX5402898.1 LysM peptidoglycan-binding domain-containing protein [Streptomyces sp. NBC_00086]
MPAHGKHRRPKQHHALTRKLALAGTGGAALALPLISATTAGAAEATLAPTTYSVVSGDTLSKIAAEHSIGGGWQKLYEANKGIVGADPSAIRPGLKLNLTAAAAPVAAKAAKAPTGYANNLDGWIRESLDVLAQHGIPGSYEGIHRNIMRESSGNPLAINNWDSNAAAGIPSKGLLQVIDPTFKAYHVPGTSLDSYDPVANITAACNYAAARYGSIDNVNGPY